MISPARGSFGVGSAVENALRVGFEPQANFMFNVEIEGLWVAQFKSVSGLGVNIDTIEYRAGTDKFTRKRPGRAKFSNINLKRGVMLWQHDTVYNWIQSVIDGKMQRKSGSIVLWSDAGWESARFNFYEAWPCKWKGWDFQGQGNDSAIEELEICCEYIERFKVPGPGFLL